MNGSGGSAWPTATSAMTTGAGHEGRDGGLNLQTAASSWPTPMAGTPAQNGNSAAGNSDFSRRAEELAQAMWMTPDTPSGGRKMPDGTTITGQTPDGRKVTVGLENQTRLWGTPKGSDGEKGGPNMAYSEGGTPLPAQAAQWTTPQAHDVTMRGAGQKPTAKAGNACLARDATTWPTPAARDHKSENSADHLKNGTGRLHMDQLPNAVAHGFSHPAPETALHGPKLSQLRRIWRPLRDSLISSHGRATWRRLWASRIKRRLNPIFVEQLMGWPKGHALCDCSAMEFARWQQDMRGALSALPTASAPWIWAPPAEEIEPTQREMF